jgi:hypothetical protein
MQAEASRVLRGRRSPVICHAACVDLPRVRAHFSPDRRQRATLYLPFRGRRGPTLCVVGQNPSAADETVADKTIRYLEDYAAARAPHYGGLLILNLYSRIDTTKAARRGLTTPEMDACFVDAVAQHQEFLLVSGRLAVEGAWDFPARARRLRALLAGRRVYKLDLGTPYAPHPGNPRILYRNFDVPLAPHDFADLD